jgi:hypothetical protein
LCFPLYFAEPTSSKKGSFWPKVVMGLALFSTVAITGTKMTPPKGSNVPHLKSLAASSNSIDVSIQGVYDNYEAMTKYPFLGTGEGLLIEPHRTSTLSVTSPVEGATYTWSVGKSLKGSLQLSDLSDEVEVIEGTESLEVTRGATGAYSLVLTETINDVVTRTSTFTLHSKYVRRELRTLTEEHREAYLKAASTLWKVSTKEGRQTHNYGDNYRDINSIAIIHNDLAANVVRLHYEL